VAESASELYRSSDRRLSVKLVPTFADRGVSRSQRGESPTAVISVSRPEPLLFLSSISPIALVTYDTPYPQELVLSLPTSGIRSAGIVRTKATDLNSWALDNN
jgi:hypothetical protein